ncbi:BQ5605_C016g08250 [Microbotryum silenes-dioicae]|uniref:BQ5605_C016g08250 protein n=1 Tax=Microbotryum silenes-dioicae TaxID=796604 RepID=A0A2X0NZ64_9BASI|nr:BQ5605_C016g08250 [Microbotryum silenes-dioicae]
MSNSDDDLDNFFLLPRRTPEPPSPTQPSQHISPSPSPSPSPPHRTRTRRAREQSDEQDEDQTPRSVASSSDVEIIASTSRRVQGRNTIVAGPSRDDWSRTKTKRSSLHTASRPRPALEARSSRLGLSDSRSGGTTKAAEGASDDDDEDEELPPPIANVPRLGDLFNSEGGAALRAMAKANGWRGATPSPPKRTVLTPRNGVAASKGKGKGKEKEHPTSESDSTTTVTRGRRTSSTAPTSHSDLDDQLDKARYTATRQPRSEVSKGKAKEQSIKRPRRVSPTPTPEPPVEFDETARAPAPEPFWGTEAIVMTSATAKEANRHQHGAATEALRRMSELGAPRIDQTSHLEDEIVDDEDEDRGEGGAQGIPFQTADKYETVAAKAKREKAESMGESFRLVEGSILRAVRQRKAEAAAAASTKSGRTSSNTPRPKQLTVDNLLVSMSTAKERCLMCNAEVLKSELQAHTNQCLDAGFSQDDFSQAHVPPRPYQASAPPRPALDIVDDDPVHDSQEIRARLAAELFSPSPPHRATASRAQDKGKGRAVELPSVVAAPRTASRHQQLELQLDDDEDEEEYWSSDTLALAETDLFDEPRTSTRARRNEVIEIEDDDDVVRARGSGGINTEHRPGPPQDGSSPPRGSLYVSTMSAVIRGACELCFVHVIETRV